MIAVIDNYDSFVHNLARYLVRLGNRTEVFRNDAISVDQLRALQPTAIIISPGPNTPSEAGVSMEVVRELHREIPILGVCLGHQAIGEALGATVRRSAPAHGRSSTIFHDRVNEFRRMPSQFDAGRYHALVIDPSTVPASLAVSAWTEDGTIMAVRHRQYPVCGWQFHPESVLTPLGSRLLESVLTDMHEWQASLLPDAVTNLEATGGVKRAS